MALKKIIEIDGVLLLKTDHLIVDLGTSTVNDEFYVRVDNLTGTKELVTASVSYRSGNKLFNKTFAIPMSTKDGAKNFIAQTYDYLKTLPEFAGAIDC